MVEKCAVKTIGLLKNTVQEYAWGCHTAISELLGEPSPSEKPQAELWMGAHPKAPSMVKIKNKWTSLLDLIEEYPQNILGKKVAEKFGNRLPYLFKVLAVAKPLSLQAHPSLMQAKRGFKKENALGIPLDAPNRNYRDANHKPECIYALTPFWGLNGFRKISETLHLLKNIQPKSLDREIFNLRKHMNSQGLKYFFTKLMTMGQGQKKQAIEETVLKAKNILKDDIAFQWIIRLHNEYPNDIGVLSPIFLNLVCLKPGQAMFLPAGDLHAYLYGVGLELMANSDNVLRGGLTPKHVDVPELMEVINFEEREVNILVPEKTVNCEAVYPCRAEEFTLSVLVIKKETPYLSSRNRGVEIFLCTEGKATVTDSAKKDKISIEKGTSFIIPAAVKNYQIKGNATLYKASVPF